MDRADWGNRRCGSVGITPSSIGKGPTLTDQNAEHGSGQHDNPGQGTSPGPPGEPQVPVPPYDELRTGTGENTAPKAFDATNAPAPEGGIPVTEEERKGVSSTEMDPEGPHGVGVSRGGRGEDQARDRDDVDTKGADRPVGRAGEERSGSVMPGSPDLQSGDQGG